MAIMRAFARDSSSESSGEEDDFLLPSADPNADEFEDYNPRKRRRPGGDPKESAALGIFGPDSEDDRGPVRRWKKKILRGRGMAFVSSGQKVGGEDENDELEADEGEQNGDEDGDVDMEDAAKPEETAGLRGLEFGTSKGLGWQSPAQKTKGLGSTHNTPLGKGFVPSSAAAPVLLTVEDAEESTPRVARPSAFSTPTNGAGKKNGTPINAGSFAARMMAKMGYKEGSGLGKEGQGRSGAIEVQLRPQGVGLGAVTEKSKHEREEEKRQARLKGEKVEDTDEERKKRRRKPKTSAAGSGVSSPRKVAKPKFRTVEEVQKAAPGLQIPEAFAPILDMTAPGQRLLTSTSGIMTPTTASESVEQAESRKLARRAQNDLLAFVEEWKNLEERKAYIEMEIIQQQQEVDEQERQFDQMKSFAQAVEGISGAAMEGQWDPVFTALMTTEGLEISAGVNEELSNIAVAAVHPFLRQFTEGWQPLDDPKLSGMAPSLFKIRHVLGTASDDKALAGPDVLNGTRRNRMKTTPYESMIYKIIFPKVVSAINQTWDVYNPTPLLSLFDAWDSLLPSFVRSQILDQALINKLNSAVLSWNPRKRRSYELPHLWLFPWLQYLPVHHADPSSSTGLVSDVKRKFRHLIDAWDLRKGVVPGLFKWREVLQPRASNDHWTPLIMNHVLPGMAKFLKNPQNFQVDPNDQSPYMSALQGILAWSEKGILKPLIVGQVIVDSVLPMWQDVLYQWLTVVGPNEEIGQWFEWWRDEVFPENIKSLPSIQNEFQKGHDMINHALDLGAEGATLLPAPSQAAQAQAQADKERKLSPPAPAEEVKAPVVEEVTFRHRVEDWCIENDLQFLPEKKVLHFAGPLYRITAAANGKFGVLVYFKGDSLWAVQRRDKEEGLDMRIQWESEEGKDALLGMAWMGVT